MPLVSDDTIAPISTPPGRGGIGIVRLSGSEARATGEPLDEAIVTFFEAPNSYTTEDVVEIASHGQRNHSHLHYLEALLQSEMEDRERRSIELRMPTPCRPIMASLESSSRLWRMTRTALRSP